MDPREVAGIFFPLPKRVPLEDEENPFATHSSAAAKKVCNTVCPVREECLEYAIEANEEGVWGGKTKRERRAIKKKRMQREL